MSQQQNSSNGDNPFNPLSNPSNHPTSLVPNVHPHVLRDNDEISDIIFGYDRSFTHGFSEGFTKATNEESENSQKLGKIHGQKIGLDVGVMIGVARTLLALEVPSLVTYENENGLQNIDENSRQALSKLSINCLSLIQLCNEIDATSFLPEDALFELLDKARKKYRLICAQAKLTPNVGPDLHSPVQSCSSSVEVQRGQNEF